MGARTFVIRVLFVLSGLLIWAVHFLAIYPLNALACVYGFAESEVLGIGAAALAILLLGAVALAALSAVLFAAAKQRRPLGNENGGGNESFLRMLTISIALLSAVAVVWETVPVFIIPPCA